MKTAYKRTMYAAPTWPTSVDRKRPVRPSHTFTCSHHTRDGDHLRTVHSSHRRSGSVPSSPLQDEICAGPGADGQVRHGDRTFLSKAALAMYRPSGEKEMWLTAWQGHRHGHRLR
jgi:hypothetical protein